MSTVEGSAGEIVDQLALFVVAGADEIIDRQSNHRAFCAWDRRVASRTSKCRQLITVYRIVH